MVAKEYSRRQSKKRVPEKDEYERKVIDIARVARVVKGGKRFSFRTVVVIGNRKGKVGVGMGKGPDMRISTEKAFADAKKNLITLGFKGNTIPYPVTQKMGGAKIMLKPAAKGNGIVAGGAVRTVVSLAGISDISGKALGSRNKLNNARATIEALKQFSVKKTREIIEEEKKVKEKEEKANKKEKEKKIKSTKEQKKTE